jgi:hypothetical protein
MLLHCRAFFLFVFLLITIAAHAQLSLDSVQGVWQLSKWTRPEKGLEVIESFPPLPDDNIWIFEGDTLFRIYYPYQCEGIEKVRIDSDRMFTGNSNRFPYAVLRLDSGRLVASVDDGFQLHFSRKPLTGDSAKAVQQLQRDSVNYHLLVGKFAMVTHFVPDDEAAYDFKPPVPMPSSIWLANGTSALGAVQSGVIYIQAGSRRRPFYLREIRWNGYLSWENEQGVWNLTPELVLVPGEWWEGEPFQVIYKMPEKTANK